MSTASSKIREDQASVLPFQSQARQKFHRFLTGLAALVPEVLADLEHQNDDEILKTRSSAHLLEESAWRIHCACDAQFVERAVKLRGGRGLKDVTAIGVKATIAKRAKQIGVTPRTVEKNAQVFRLMQTETSVLANATLRDKHFYISALSAANPEYAINLFAEKKRDNPKFKVSDSYRLLAAEGLTKQQANQRAVDRVREATGELSGRGEQIDHIKQTIEWMRNEVVTRCSDEETMRIHEGYISELQDHLNFMFDEDVKVALRESWDKGNHHENELSADTGFPAEVVARVMGALHEESEFIPVPYRGAENKSRRWHKVGEELPPELRGR